MYFLVDFENVYNIGLEGVEHLAKDDTVVIFYGRTCERVKRYRLNQILDSGCRWEICELVRIGKNALDFYIASKVGEIFASDPNAAIGIVSKDKGFRAVKDYWKMRVRAQNRLVQGETVCECMRKGYDDTGRWQQIRNEYEAVSLIEEYKCYLETRRIEDLLNDRLGNSIYETSIPKIISIIRDEAAPRGKYLAMLRTFGIKEGLDVYRVIKDLPATEDAEAV